MMFQMTFAIITPALITGAFAERMKFSAMLVFIGLWSIWSTAPIAHWVWGGGFLFGAGRARLRRRHRGPHQRRCRRSGRALWCWASARATAPTTWPRTTWS